MIQTLTLNRNLAPGMKAMTTHGSEAVVIGEDLELSVIVARTTSGVPSAAPYVYGAWHPETILPRFDAVRMLDDCDEAVDRILRGGLWPDFTEEVSGYGEEGGDCPEIDAETLLDQAALEQAIRTRAKHASFIGESYPKEGWESLAERLVEIANNVFDYERKPAQAPLAGVGY